jgi:hypothetical protein
MGLWVTTAEVTISKIFPAGFGWQYFGAIAADMGIQSSEVGFALMTGLGDMTGVFLGHTLFYTAKKVLADPSIKVKDELQTGFFLGSAAFCSGFAWQPIVNLLQAQELPFVGVALGTWAVCGASFYGGLRLFRTVYSPIMPAIAPASSQNTTNDALLSVSIGGAGGAFVGTDTVYMGGEGNFLRPLVGVEATDSVLVGCTKAGSATGLGFAVAQTAQNIVVPNNWTR